MLKKTLYPLLIILFIILGYRQIIFLSNTLVYDSLDIYFPWRYFIGESLQNGMLPLWEPYQHLGSPIHANPNSSIWYPITQLLALLFGYSMKIVHFEFMLHVGIAAFGFYKLSKHLNLSSPTASILSISYIFSGFFIGNAQHINWIISAAWIPIVFLTLLKTLNKPSLKYGIACALALFMLITGGYPALSIATAYIILIIIVIHIYNRSKSQTIKLFPCESKKLILTILLSSILLTIMLLPELYSMAIAKDYMLRGSPLGLKSTLSTTFTPQCSLSFIFPFSTVESKGFFDTDISMRNAYFGIIPLFGLLYSFSDKTFNKRNFLIFSAGILFLLISFGTYTPIYELLHSYIPGFSYFRTPAIFRIFSIIAFLLASGDGLDKIINYPSRKRGLALLSILLAISGLIAIYSFAQAADKLWPLIKSGQRELYNATAYFDYILLMTPRQIGSIVLIVSVFFIKKEQLRALALCLIAFINITVIDQFNFPYTVISPNTVAATDAVVSALPKGFPIPNTKIGEFKERKHQTLCYYYNLGIFHKKHSTEGYNSFIIKDYSNLCYRNDRPFLDSITNNKFVFLSYSQQNKDFIIKQRDTAYITSYNPRGIDITVNNSQECRLNILQNYFPLWQATIDGKKGTIFKANKSLMGITIPKGNHKVHIYYKTKTITFLFIISSSVFIICILFFIMNNLKKSN